MTKQHPSSPDRVESPPSGVLLGVFAKAPEPGKVKTRLAAEIGTAKATALARAFLTDVWQSAAAYPGTPSVLILDGDPAELDLSLSRPAWSQGAGDLGERLQRAFEHGLRECSAMLIVGTDSPGLPAEYLDQARLSLDEHDAVLGPSRDGGYYLIGLRRCPAGLLHGLPWSSPNTFEATRERLTGRGLSVAELSPWYDVDQAQDLERLNADLSSARINAPATRRVLAALFEPSVTQALAPAGSDNSAQPKRDDAEP